ncbi:MAG: hypothetical protein ACRELC_09605 [Gemmatimonadota bacterium]
MFEFLGTFLWLMITAVASIGGYITVKRFVQNRLRYVDAIQRPFVPVVAGAVAAGIALPVVGLLPFMTAGTAILFGIGAGAGVAAGRRELKQLPGA